jgi:uncharacterized protein
LDLTTALLILVTGFAVGWINNLAGAAGALGLIAFDWLLGMDVMAANAAIRPSALGIGLGGLIGFLSKKQEIPTKMWAYALLTVPGAVLGSFLVRPELELLFQLTLGALLLVVLGQSFANKSGGDTHGERAPSPLWLLLLLFSWLGAHMGFIQVGTGLVSIFILSIVHSRDLVRVNAAKMVFVLIAAVTSNVTLAIQDKIVWGPALYLAAGAGVGSFLASRWSVKKGHGAVRFVVIGICVVVIVRLAFQIFD